jgi:hypothetical protein
MISGCENKAFEKKNFLNSGFFVCHKDSKPLFEEFKLEFKKIPNTNYPNSAGTSQAKNELLIML